MARGLNTIESAFEELTISQRERSNSQCTDNSIDDREIETRLGRSFAPPLYGNEEHRYHLPVDEDALDQQSAGHALWLSYRLILPPWPAIPDGCILDLGAGGGLWAQDVSRIYYDTSVIGIDYYFDDKPETPYNCAFELHDCEEKFLPQDEPIALINLRHSDTWLRNPAKLIGQVFGTLCPGGWFQNEEIRLQKWTSNKERFNRWQGQVIDSAYILGVPLHSAEEIQEGIHISGFEDYNETKLTWQASWEDDTTQRALEFVRCTVKDSVGILIQGGSFADDVVSEIVEGVIKELDEQDCHIVMEAHMCFARKPAEAMYLDKESAN